MQCTKTDYDYVLKYLKVTTCILYDKISSYLFETYDRNIGLKWCCNGVINILDFIVKP